MKTVKLKSNGLGRYDDVSPFLVESGGLEVQFMLPNTSGEFFLVTELNGKTVTYPIPPSGEITLSGLEAGELRAEVKHYLRGELIETFKVEPLLLKAVEKGLSAMPEIALLTGEIAALNAEKEALANELASAVSRLDESEKSIAELYAFAYAVYENSPLLNGRGLSFEAFKEALKKEKIEEEL